MDIIQAAALALLQGLTEFLPISSSAHLILLPLINGWHDQGIAFDVAVHVGTLTAVVAYFRHDLHSMFTAWVGSVRRQVLDTDARLAWYVLWGTVPVGLVGISLPDHVQIFLRSPLVIATATLVFALLLWWSEKKASEMQDRVTMKAMLIIGLFQTLALIPGTSRSGITITAGLFCGLQRELAARYSFLLSIPVIALAGLVEAYGLLNAPESVRWDLLLIGAVISAVVAYLTIGWFLKLLDNIGLLPFVCYRLILGIILLAIFL